MSVPIVYSHKLENPITYNHIITLQCHLQQQSPSFSSTVWVHQTCTLGEKLKGQRDFWLFLWGCTRIFWRTVYL